MDHTSQTPIEDLVKQALDHYEEASLAIHHWNSLIPRALKFYQENYHKVSSEKSKDQFKKWAEGHFGKIEKNKELVTVWTMRHINSIVWVIATDAALDIDNIYTPTEGSGFPTKAFKVHDKWKPDSLNRYLVTEISE